MRLYYRGGVGEAIAILDSGYYLSQVLMFLSHSQISGIRPDIKIQFTTEAGYPANLISGNHNPIADMFVSGRTYRFRTDICLDIRYPAGYFSKYPDSGRILSRYLVSDWIFC